MYPSEKYPFDGIFIKEQIEDLKRNYRFQHEIFLIESVHKTKLEYIKSILTIQQYITKYKPDIIHIHYGLSGFFLLFFKPKIKIFLTLHGSDFNNRGSNFLQVWLSKRIISKVDTIFVQNTSMKEQALKYNNKTEVLTCGVDTDFFKPDQFIKKENKDKIILFPSNPTRKVKNYPLFLETIKILEEKYQHKIIPKNLENVSRIQVKELLSKSDCLVMTSITEGSPQVIKEALSCGLPVVSVPVGDVTEMVKGIPNCYISSSHDPNKLAKLVDTTLKNNAQGIREAFLLKKHFNNTEIAKRLSTFYEINPRNNF
jgi:glycosyltransferase involved in cell wall biosynthesis